MRKSPSTELSIALLSIVCALMSVSAAWVHNDMKELSFGINQPYTRLEVTPQNESPQTLPDPVNIINYLKKHSLSLISISHLESSPSIIGYDPKHQTWFPSLTDTQALAIKGTYSEELFTTHKRNPYIDSHMTVVGTISLPRTVKSHNNQTVQQISRYALPLGTAAVSTTNPQQLNDLSLLFAQLNLSMSIHRPVTLLTAILQNPAFIVCTTFYLCGLISSILMWSSNLKERYPEIFIHHEYGGTALGISLLRTRIQIVPLLICCIAGAFFGFVVMVIAGRSTLSPVENSALAIGAIANMCILSLSYFITNFVQLLPLLHETSKRR